MFRLLLLRSLPLFFRPAAVLFDGSFTNDKYFLVMVLPISMMALSMSSIPVHFNYFKSHPGRQEYSNLAKVYASALTWLTLLSLISLSAILLIVPLGLSVKMIMAIVMVFFIEKLSDESSRMLDFRKDFLGWFFVQSFRSGWLFLPVIASFLGLNYEVMFLVIGAVCCVAIYYFFIKLSGLRPRFNFQGLVPIRDNLVFLVGSLLPSSYRQVPRIVIAKLYPEQAYIFLAMAQLAQGIGLVFNVRFQIPYRKFIARRTLVFQRLLQPIMWRILIPSVFVAMVYLVMSFIIGHEHLSDIIVAILLVPLLIADALMFCILTSYLGYLPWFVRKSTALTCYLMCIIIGLFIAVLFGLIFGGYLSLICVPALATIIGLVWLIIIKIQFF